MRSLLLTIAMLAIVVGWNSCSTEHKPSYEELQAENQELHEKMSEALSKIEDAENQLSSLKDEIAQAQDEASYYRACEMPNRPPVAQTAMLTMFNQAWTRPKTN